MRKLMLMLFIALVSMTSFKALADPAPTMAYGVYFAGGIYPPGAIGADIQRLSFGVNSSQPPALFQPAYNFTNFGNFVEPARLFILGGYWVAPSIATPLTININSGYTAQVANIYPTVAITVKMAVRVANSNGSGVTTYYGPAVTIQPGAIATLSLPTVSVTYTSALTSLVNDPNYQIPVEVFITN